MMTPRIEKIKLITMPGTALFGVQLNYTDRTTKLAMQHRSQEECLFLIDALAIAHDLPNRYNNDYC